MRIYKTTDIEVVALQGLDLHVNSGELITIVGASGSGKSTLMNVLGGLDRPTAGRASVAGHDLMDMDGPTRTRYRRDVIGFVWQNTARNLVPYLDARANVELPMALAGTARRRAAGPGRAAARGRRARPPRPATDPGSCPAASSRRVSIAVALANEPKVLLADEPTGELDSETAGEIFGVLRTVNQTHGGHRRHRHPRPAGLHPGGPHRHHPGRADQLGDAARPQRGRG